MRKACFFLVLALAGCLPGGPAALVIPEQTRLDLRGETALPGAPLPRIPPPATVSQPEPAGAPSQLTLDDALRIALQNSRVVRTLAGVSAVPSGSTIYDPAISNTAIDEARAAFDPVLAVNNNWNRFETPRAVLAPKTTLGAFITGIRTDEYDFTTSLSKRTVTGGTAKLSYNDSVTRFQPGVFPLNPEERSALQLSYTQPLLQGASVEANVAPIVIARINTERSFFQYKDSVQELVRGVIDAYWAVVFARTDVWARRKQYEQAEENFKLTDARLRTGAKGGSAADVAQTRVSMLNFQNSLVAAEANLLQREAALRNLLGLPPTDPPRLELITAPSTAKLEPEWDEIVRLAEERRPDLIELKLILEADQQVLLQARNQALPRVDAVFLYQWNGLEGRTPSGATIGTDPGQFTDWTLGVNFSVPLGLRKERAALRSAELFIARDQANLEQGLHSVVHQLAASMRNLAQAYEQYRILNEARIAAKTNLDQQNARFRAGLTIYLNVLLALTDWGNAVSAEAQALSQYNTELANLERQTGTILETHGIWFFEERARHIGPAGRLGHGRLYPAGVLPGANVNRYPDTVDPSQRLLELERPAAPKDLPLPQKLDEKKAM
jgi:outer membrane protein TolC